MFTKAEPLAAYLKAAVYGPPGSGKTFSTLMFAEGLAKWRNKRIAFVDTERGTKFYAGGNPASNVHPEPFDFDVLHTRSLSETLDAVRGIDPKVHSVVVIDSITHIWNAAIEAYEGRMTKGETIPMHAWGKIKKPYKELVDLLIHGEFDAFILGREKKVFKNTAGGELLNTGVTMKAEGETAYEPDFCFRMEGIVDQNDTTKTTYRMHVEKDRSRTLAGQIIANPTFKTIEPILPLLGEDVIPHEDEDERLARDGELQAKMAQKAKDKEAKSAERLTTFQGKIAAASTMEEVGTIGGEIKKQSRYMLDKHVDVLRATYQLRLKAVQDATVPEV